MRDVSVIGIGQTQVAEHWDRSLRHLAADAVLAAMEDAGIEPGAMDALYVGNMLSGLLTGQEHLTIEGTLFGTPDYSSPEQLQEGPISAQSDIYRLGAVIYEMLTGERPYPDVSPAKVIQNHL